MHLFDEFGDKPTTGLRFLVGLGVGGVYTVGDKVGDNVVGEGVGGGVKGRLNTDSIMLRKSFLLFNS